MEYKPCQNIPHFCEKKNVNREENSSHRSSHPFRRKTSSRLNHNRSAVTGTEGVAGRRTLSSCVPFCQNH